MREPNNTMIHFYRAIVMHADTWRKRLDATTNWAVVTTAGLTSFTFATESHPHYMLLMAFAFNTFFLIMESRRYQVYDLWRDRIRRMNRWMVAPELDPDANWNEDVVREELASLAKDLGSTLPLISLRQAIGYRIRRNYGFVTFMVAAAWLLKLYVHPLPAHSFLEFVSRAQTGFLPGWVFLVAMSVLCSIILYLGLSAPSERMHDWRPYGSPLDTILRR